MSWEPNPEQRAAIEARGEVFVSAGAGTGKTAVLVERFARAVCDDGLDVDSILVITYTRKAAGELRSRIREALLARGRPDAARGLDGAWISTIHGFCNRLLRAYPFAAGLDPRFRELDEPQAAVLRGEAFDEALAEFCAGGEPERLRLLVAYGGSRLRGMLIGIYETLRAAGRPLVLELGEAAPLDERIDELREAARCLVGDVEATPTQRDNCGRAPRTPRRARRSPERLLDLAAFRNRGERAASYEEARKRVEQAALDTIAAGDRELLQELLERFDAAYSGAKERESALDFEDLQLAARDLLAAHPEIREREQLRFRALMVDEFQDTNRLQCELVDLLAEGPGERELFFVGDEFQSIYGFRHADVAVFRDRRERAGGGLALTRNYRSRPEVLAAVNFLFGEEFGDEFQPLAASGDFPDPVFGHPVELLVTDKASYADTGEHWRRGEARNIARRVRELVDTGAAEAGEIVLLFAAGTDAEWYEEELRRAGLPTYRATGRGYFGQQQVVDVLAYLRLLQNRYDDQALLTVLASPLVGVSNDALVLIRRAAPRRPLFTGVERDLPPGLHGDDERLLRAFRQRYDRLVAVSARLSLERLCERIVADHDYDLAVLAQWDGKRRYANLRKLARLARSYEELRGRDSEGFVRFVRQQEAVGARELEAVAEEEGTGAVRLLTIHAAKGLEFKVVIVADAGRDRPAPAADEILALSDGRFGFKVADPYTSKRRGAFAYDEVRAAREAEDRAERLRLYYVAMTRAIDRLIVSGALDPEQADETPIGWVLRRVEPGDDLRARRGGAGRDRAGRRAPLAEGRTARSGAGGWRRRRSRRKLLPSPRSSRCSRRRTTAACPSLPCCPRSSPCPRRRSTTFAASPTARSALFERCSYRFFAERVAGMRERRPVAVPGEGDDHGAGGLLATELGDAVHRLLEQRRSDCACSAGFRAGADVVSGGDGRRDRARSGGSSRPTAPPRSPRASPISTA